MCFLMVPERFDQIVPVLRPDPFVEDLISSFSYVSSYFKAVLRNGCEAIIYGLPSHDRSCCERVQKDEKECCFFHKEPFFHG